MKKRGFFLLGIVLALFSVSIQGNAENQSSYNEKIWMTSPGDITKNWEGQTFHLGNGYFAVSCYGGALEELFSLGEKTFWTGGPGDSETNNYGIIKKNRTKDIASLKKCISVGDFKNADEFLSKIFTSDLSTIGGLSTVGELFMDFKKEFGPVMDYKRTLDLNKSVAQIEYKINDVKFNREYFCSYPDRVLAMKLTADKPQSISFTIGVNLAHKKRNPQTVVSATDGTIEINGNIDDNNRPYTLIIKVVNQGGQLKAAGSTLEVVGSDKVEVYYTVATNYKLEAPLYKGADPKAITQSVIAKVSNQGYNKTREIHIADYQNLYKRTDLKLENEANDRENLPTNERLKFYTDKEDYKDLGLKELAFNFGKYILISASRPNALPAGLQGAWNYRYLALWNGTYQLDMNVTQTYMYGNALNLPECQEPMIDYIENLATVGKEIVKSYYGIEGWSSFMISDIWGHAGILPDLEHKFFSSGWVSLILWEQYAFEGDLSYLKEIYPILKGASMFYLQNLVDYKNTGNLVFAGGVSAEHYSPLGASVPGFQDIGVIQETFENYITASKILNVDYSFRKKIAKAKGRLMPYKIGRLGQFQEWVEDIDDPNCKHRHLNHLLGLHPCKQLSPYKYPELAEAMKVSSNLRGDADNKALYGIGTNNIEHASKCLHEKFPYDFYSAQVWCRAARMCNWIRLFDGDRADKIYNDIFRESTLENMMQYETRANYDVDADTTPFFLDGTVLSAGYVTEMVLQSQYGFLDLLPALPSTWKTGHLNGIKARGGYIVDVEWKDGNLVKAVIRNDKKMNCKIHYKGKDYSAEINPNEEYIFQPSI